MAAAGKLMPVHRRCQVHRDTARRMVELSGSPARIGHHFLAAGAGADAAPHLLSAAETESAVGAYRDALALVEAIPAARRRSLPATCEMAGIVPEMATMVFLCSLWLWLRPQRYGAILP
jgi:hypothetical protein